MNTTDRTEDVLEITSQAGHILLENGAEISRVEDTMERIATHFGVPSGHFFVLSNGIFTTSPTGKYAKVEFIPIRSIQLSKVVEINRLSYDIAAGKYTLEEVRARLSEIKTAPSKPLWEQILGSAFGAAGFCVVFGGGFADSAVAFIAGALLCLFGVFVGSRFLSKIVGGICNALIATAICLVLYRLGFGSSLGNIIIGAIMPLIPGIPFVNGVRDLADSDYIAGLTRLTDAMLGFFCIAMGVSIAFMADGLIFGGIMKLSGMITNPETASIVMQSIGAFVGTLAFAVLFGVPRKQYTACGVIGAIGWAVYLALTRYCTISIGIAILLSSVVICILSRVVAVKDKCPSTVFLLCGIFPLVPGAGIFWCTYYLVSADMQMAAFTGFNAVKAAIAIVLGIIFAMELPQKVFSKRKVKR